MQGELDVVLLHHFLRAIIFVRCNGRYQLLACVVGSEVSTFPAKTASSTDTELSHWKETSGFYMGIYAGLGLAQAAFTFAL